MNDPQDLAGRRGAPAVLGLKRCFDVVIALLALPFVLMVAVVLVLLNPLANRGPLFFFQRRMGRGCAPFTLVKFRSMTPGPAARAAYEPLEDTRITPLGRLLRRSRIDELPQFLNVLRGDMSLIGPRPDCWDHAIHYMDSIPDYRHRHIMRPGITGLAQVEGGYADSVKQTMDKTRLDLHYITRFGLRMEAYVLWRTVFVVLTGHGAR